MLCLHPILLRPARCSKGGSAKSPFSRTSDDCTINCTLESETQGDKYMELCVYRLRTVLGHASVLSGPALVQEDASKEECCDVRQG